MSKEIRVLTEKEIGKITKLPHGEGNISVTADKKRLMYQRKYQEKKLCVYGFTVKEVREKMMEKIKEVEVSYVKGKAMPLIDAMLLWLKNEKSITLKDGSYDRLECTIKNQI